MDGSDDRYITSIAIRRRFGICNNTLRSWGDSGRLATVRLGGETGKRLYRLADVERAFVGYTPKGELGKIGKAAEARARVCYARVSSQKQKADLDRQVEALQIAFPGHEIVKDVGSGINWRRPGLVSLLDRVLRRDVEEVVVSHRDRLCRFAFELLEHVFRESGCKIVVQDQTIGDRPSDESELKDDLLAIITVFVASNNGRRAAANRREKKRREREADGCKGKEEGEGGEGGRARERREEGKEAGRAGEGRGRKRCREGGEDEGEEKGGGEEREGCEDDEGGEEGEEQEEEGGEGREGRDRGDEMSEAEDIPRQGPEGSADALAGCGEVVL